MFGNYLKTALRHLRRQKGYSLLNISGLALGMACAILIVFYIQHELSYDRFHKDVDHIFRVTTEGVLNGRTANVAVTPIPLGPELSARYPEVTAAARIAPLYAVNVSFSDREFREAGIIYADPGLFDVFTFPLIRGEGKTALARPATVLLTERTAKKYFGTADPIGKFLAFDDQSEYAVAGILQDIPQNSHLRFDLVLSLESFFAKNPGQRGQWFQLPMNLTYVRLTEPGQKDRLEAKLPTLVEEKWSKFLSFIKSKADFRLQRLTDIHLRSRQQFEFSGRGAIIYLYIFGAVAVFILAIAGINFVNLSTARSSRRAREVGLRKVVGANRRDIIWQFLGESTSASLLALMMALVFVRLALSLFKSVSGIELAIGAGELVWLVPGFFVLVIVVGFGAGSYPAVYISAFQPVRALKGGSETGGGNVRFRRVLVVGQFILSVIMICGTRTIGDQIRYMKAKDLGFQKDQVLAISTSDRKILPALDQVKSRLKEIPGVLDVSATTGVPGQPIGVTIIFPEGVENADGLLYRFIEADIDYVRTMGMEIVKGSDFSPDNLADNKTSILINEAAVRQLGWTDPIGKTIRINESPSRMKTRRVIGVVKNFHFASLRETIDPLYINNELEILNALAVKIKAEEAGRIVGELKRAWKSLAAGTTFDYFFVDELFDAQYRSEERLNTVFSSFSFLAIAIACLGLFGLASFLAEQKKKEIGIRKVLGASIGEVVGMLTREFLLLVGLAVVVAWPLAFFAMNVWLRGFAYRIGLQPLTFIGSGLAALAIACLTVSYQAVRAASANPVDSLKYE